MILHTLFCYATLLVLPIAKLVSGRICYKEMNLTRKHFIIIIAGVIILVLLVIIFGSTSRKNTQNQKSTTSLSTPTPLLVVTKAVAPFGNKATKIPPFAILSLEKAPGGAIVKID